MLTRVCKAYHGPDQAWKYEPVHKSPLSVLTCTSSLPLWLTFNRWYNVPPDPSKKRDVQSSTALAASSSALLNGEEGDSKPLNFDTFVPTHNPSLEAIDDEDLRPPPPGGNATADEAFQKALESTYWAGYWTAVYHVGIFVVDSCQALTDMLAVSTAFGRTYRHRTTRGRPDLGSRRRRRGRERRRNGGIRQRLNAKSTMTTKRLPAYKSLTIMGGIFNNAALVVPLLSKVKQHISNWSFTEQSRHRVLPDRSRLRVTCDISECQQIS